MKVEQLAIFSETECCKKLTISEIATQLAVSEATVRNWIHEGVLKAEKNFLFQKDIDTFINSSYNKKLSSPANKSQKDIHDHTLLSSKIEKELSEGNRGDTISEIYENSLSESYKNKEGIFYTPQYIVSDMLRNISDVKNKTFLDPCCGTGNFIIEAIKKGFSVENVYGFDIDSNAVEITKKRIFELTGIECENIICGDFLNMSKSLSKKFDYIYTNPPWGKKILKKERERLSKLHKTGNSNDTCALFYFAALDILADGGIMGFLLPDAFFNVGTFEDARKSLLQYKIIRLADYQKAFKGLLTKAKAFIVEKSEGKNVQILCEKFNKESHLRGQSSFKNQPKSILNFETTQEEYEIIRNVLSYPYLTLKNNAEWALGIVTGDNEKHCKKQRSEKSVSIYKGKDIFPDYVNEPTIFIDKNLEGCQQVAPLKYYKAKEKVIYRFISNKIICYYDTERRYVLNSANLFILKEGFPMTYPQVVAMLNSDFMNWLFKITFSTHKILRGDLEELPLWNDYYSTEKEFSEEKLLEYLNIEKHNGTYRIAN